MNEKIRQEIMEILTLCLNKNLMDNYDIFFNFSGHVNILNLRIYKKNYKNIFNKKVFLDEYNSEKTLEKWKIYLEKLLF